MVGILWGSLKFRFTSLLGGRASQFIKCIDRISTKARPSPFRIESCLPDPGLFNQFIFAPICSFRIPYSSLCSGIGFSSIDTKLSKKDISTATHLRIRNLAATISQISALFFCAEKHRRFYSRAAEGARSHRTSISRFYECRSETRCPGRCEIWSPGFRVFFSFRVSGFRVLFFWLGGFWGLHSEININQLYTIHPSNKKKVGINNIHTHRHVELPTLDKFNHLEKTHLLTHSELVDWTCPWPTYVHVFTGRTLACMYVCMHACMYVCNGMEWNGIEWNGMECNVCIYVCMYVCMYV